MNTKQYMHMHAQNFHNNFVSLSKTTSADAVIAAFCCVVMCEFILYIFLCCEAYIPVSLQLQPPYSDIVRCEFTHRHCIVLPIVYIYIYIYTSHNDIIL
jgi:hypothetical protein